MLLAITYLHVDFLQVQTSSWLVQVVVDHGAGNVVKNFVDNILILKLGIKILVHEKITIRCVVKTSLALIFHSIALVVTIPIVKNDFRRQEHRHTRFANSRTPSLQIF